MLFEDIVSAVTVQGGFDTTSSDTSSTIVGSLVNEVYKEVVSESQWMMAVESLATTVAGQATYALPENIADVSALELVDGNGNPGDWQPRSLTDIWGLQRGTMRLAGSGGVFAQTAAADGTKQIQLYPVPTTAGVAITALVALIPPDLVNGTSPAIPVDTHGRLLDATIALALMRIENRPDLAQSFEARKQELKQLLQRRKNSRMGSQSTRIQVYGYDFR
jgi:hypothetical protein